MVTVHITILDFTKAFDKIPHKRLLNELHHQLMQGIDDSDTEQHILDFSRHSIRFHTRDFTTNLSKGSDNSDSTHGYPWFLRGIWQCSKRLLNYSINFNINLAKGLDNDNTVHMTILDFTKALIRFHIRGFLNFTINHTKGIDNGDTVHVTILDFTKAFHKISHKRLLNELQQRPKWLNQTKLTVRSNFFKDSQPA